MAFPLTNWKLKIEPY